MKIIKNTSFQFVFLLLFLFLINIFSSYKFVRLDLTEDKLHSLTNPTITLLNNLEDIVSVDVYLEGDDFPAELQKLNFSLKERLDEFKAYGGNKLKIRYINLDEDKELSADFRKQIYEEGLDPSYVQVMQDNKLELLEIWAGVILRQGEVTVPIQLLQGGEFTINQHIINRFNDRIEYKIIQGLLQLTRTSVKRISFLRGHQEINNADAWSIRNKLLEFYAVDTVQLSSLKTHIYKKSVDFANSSFDSIIAIGDTSFIIKNDTISLFDKQEVILGAKNYISRYFQIQYLNSKRRNPLNISEDLRALDNTDCLIIAKPKNPFSDKEKYIIDQYIMRGGKVLWLVDMMDVNEDLLRDTSFIMSEVIEHDLDNMLYKYGARVNKDIITDSRCAPVIRKDGLGNLLSWFFYPTVTSINHNELIHNVAPIKLRYASSVDSTGLGDVKKTVILESSSSYKQFRQTTVNYKNLFNYNPENFDVPADKNNVPLALLLEGEFSSHFKGRDSDKNFKKFISDSAVKFKEKSIPTSMVVIGDGDIIKNDFINLKGNLTPVMLAFEPANYGTADFVPKYGNSVFILNVIDKLLGNDVLIPLRSRMKFPRLLAKQAITTDRKYWQMLNLFLPILSVAFLGLIIILFRKRKFSKSS